MPHNLQSGLRPSLVLQNLNSLDRLHKVMIYIRIYVEGPRMNTYRLIYSLITIIVRNNHHTQSDPYEIEYLFFGFISSKFEIHVKTLL